MMPTRLARWVVDLILTLVLINSFPFLCPLRKLTL